MGTQPLNSFTVEVFENESPTDEFIAPDFITTDINGQTHRLYDYLDSGYTVILNLDATWNGPGWNYHAGGTLQDLWEDHGPAGQPGVSPNTTDDIMVLWIEGDPNTAVSEIENSNYGNWIEPDGQTVNFPMINDDNLANMFEISYWPTIYTICPNRILSLSGQVSADQHYANLDDCPQAIATQDYMGELLEYQTTEINFGNLIINSDEYVIQIISSDDNSADNVITQSLTFAGDTEEIVTVSLLTDNYASETYLEITDENGNVVWSQGNEAIAGQYDTGSGTPPTDPTSPLTNNTQYNWEVGLVATGCYTLTVGDYYGDGLFASQWGGTDGNWTLKSNSNVVIGQMSGSDVFEGSDISFFRNNSVLININGCTDPNACNFNVNANSEDGSCKYSSQSETNIQTCNESYFWNGNEYSTNGEFQVILTNNVGCDSIATLNLTFNSSPFNQTIIGQDEAEPFNSYTYSLSYNDNMYDWNITNGNILANNGNSVEIIWGDYGIGFIEVTETNNFGCNVIHSLEVDLENNNPLEISIIAVNPSCITCNDGYIIANATGGTPNYSYLWLNNVSTNINTDLGVGVYTLYVYDSQNNYTSQTITLTAESSDILGCTDADATNYNSDATEDDGSCEYPMVDNPCDIVPTGLFVDDIIHNRVVFNWSAPSAAPSHYMIRYRPVGASSWTVMTAGPVNSNEFTGTSRKRYFMEPGTTYQWNIRARVLNEDGSTNCQSAWSASNEYTTLLQCANLENLSVSTEATWVTLMADAPSSDWGVWQSKGKLREVGTNSYRYVNGSADGINFLKGNFDASTDYEWHTKAWCTANVDENGDPDPMYHSGWGDFSAFTTEAPCDKLPTNLVSSAGNNANTAITMTWDTPQTGAPDHYFLELTSETTGQVWAWNNIAGNSNSKTKYGLVEGDEYSWRIRGACGTNGTSWATSFTQPVYYTLGAERLAGPVANLEVYPNPSRDIFNVSFESAQAQTMNVRVVNMIGEEVYTEELTEFVGSYNKVIDLGNKANGIYMLNITTNNQNINQKIVIQ